MSKNTKNCARCGHAGWEWAPVILAAADSTGSRWLCLRSDMCQARRREQGQ